MATINSNGNGLNPFRKLASIYRSLTTPEVEERPRVKDSVTLSGSTFTIEHNDDDRFPAYSIDHKIPYEDMSSYL